MGMNGVAYFSPQKKYIMPYDYRQFPLYIIFAQEKKHLL